MSKKVVYYTRSGYSKTVAEKIAGQWGAELVELTDTGKWKGLIGFLRAGYYASTGKTVEITLHGIVAPTDGVVLVSPLWAGKVIPAVSAFLKTVPRDRVHYVVTSGGSRLTDRAGFLSVTDVVRSQNDEDATLGRLHSSLA
jgi:hypothetical protein